MAERIWNVKVNGVDHVVKLNHGVISGKRTIWLDGEIVVQGKSLVDHGSKHPIMIEDKNCMVVIFTNGITFSYDLLLGSESIPAVGGKKANKQASQKISNQVKNWEELSRLLGLRYQWLSEENGILSHRLYGNVGRFFVWINALFASGIISSQIKVFARINSLESEKAKELDQQISNSTELKEIIGKSASGGKAFGVSTTTVWCSFPYSHGKQSPQEVAKKVMDFIRLISNYLDPLPQDICEMGKCDNQMDQQPQLVFINGSPMFLCKECITRLPVAYKTREKHYEASPAKLGQGLLVGFIGAIIGAVIWGLVDAFLNRIFSALALVMFFFIYWLMEKAGTKKNTVSLLIAGGLTIFGVIFGSYLAIIFYVMNEYAMMPNLYMLINGWVWLFADPSVLVMPIFFALIAVVPYIFIVAKKQKNTISVTYAPKIEVIEDWKNNPA